MNDHIVQENLQKLTDTIDNIENVAVSNEDNKRILPGLRKSPLERDYHTGILYTI